MTNYSLPQRMVEGDEVESTYFSDLEQQEKEYLLRLIDEEERRANGGGTFNRFEED